MKIIIDCNVWISFLLGFQKEFIKTILNSKHIEVYVCPQLTREIQDVSSRPKISSRINSTDVEKLFRIIHAYCEFTTIRQHTSTLVRDAKDVYLLSLAETIDADYIISGDNDLLVIGQHNNTKIVSPAQFRLIL